MAIFPSLMLTISALAAAAPLQEGACEAAAADARARIESFDLAGALAALRKAPACEEAAGGAEYLEGLLGAREAMKQGGTVDSLRDVRSAANALSRRAEGGQRRWEVASLAMRAAAAASQDERAEMALYLDEATRQEALLMAVGEPIVPFISAHELAGDLWMQVDRFEEARRAYTRAAERIGPTPRIHVGLARAANRLGQPKVACDEYRNLLTWWGARAGEPPEIIEARTYVAAAPGCAP